MCTLPHSACGLACAVAVERSLHSQFYNLLFLRCFTVLYIIAQSRAAARACESMALCGTARSGSARAEPTVEYREVRFAVRLPVPLPAWPPATGQAARRRRARPKRQTTKRGGEGEHTRFPHTTAHWGGWALLTSLSICRSRSYTCAHSSLHALRSKTCELELKGPCAQCTRPASWL